MSITDKPIFGVHNHPLSLDSGNSVKTFIKNSATVFGRKAMAITDHGSLAAIIESHSYSKDLAKENVNIKIVPGIELYLLPDKDDPTGLAYYHLTVHFDDFDTYLEACKLSKPAHDRGVYKGDGFKALTTWEELESLAGKVTLFSACFLPNTKIITSNGIKYIQDVNNKDLVFSKDGILQKVNTPTVTPYNGKMIKLKVMGCYEPIIATPDHKFLIYHNDGLEWREAKDLSSRDRLVIVNEKRKNTRESTQEFEFISSRKKCNKTIKFDFSDPETLWCIGLFIAEGYWAKDYYANGEIRCGGIGISMNHTTEQNHLERFKKWAESFGITASIFKAKNSNHGGGCRVSSVAMAGAFKKLFGGRKRADEKHIPEILKELHPDLLCHLIKGYWDGDGHESEKTFKHGKSGNYDCFRCSAATISRQLAEDILAILRRVNINYFTHKVSERTYKGIHRKDTYYISFNSEEAIQFNHWINGKIKIEFNGYFNKKIVSVDEIDYKGYVHCLSMEGDPSFQVESGVVVHNCLVGPILRPWMTGHKEFAEKNFIRLMNIAGKGRFFSEIFPYEVSKEWNGKQQKFVPVKPNECFPTGKIQVHANEFIFYLSEKYQIPMVISEDAHYTLESDKIIQDIRLGGASGSWRMSDINCLHKNDWLYNELKRLHPNKMTEALFDELVENSYKALDNFKGFDPKFKFSLPTIGVDNHICGKDCSHETSDDELTKMVLKRITSLNRIDLSDKIYRSRLNYEMKQLFYNGKVNLAPYFLTLITIVDWCEKNNVLVGPARGSAGASIVAYATGITSIDPIKEDLPFERFFDVTRVEEGLADIDTDFSDRDKVIEFIKSHWGDCFCFLGIGTSFKTKSALKDIDRHLYGSVRPITDELGKYVKTSPQGVSEEDYLKGYTDSDGVYHTGELETNEKLIEYLKNNPKNAEYMFKMIGMTRQMGTHAAGVLIAGKPIHEFIPVTKIHDKFVTQLLPKWVEKCGGVKYDILRVNTLEDIRICLKHVKERHGIEIDPWKIEDSNDFWEAAHKEPSSIFQFHTDTVRPGLQAMKPVTVQEAAILTAVFRPGATDAVSDEDPTKNMAQIFIERWTGQRDTHYIHPDLKPYLGHTMSVIVYQEQIMKIVNELGGLTMTETNQLRKAISKKNSDALIKLLQKVKNNLMENRGWTEAQTDIMISQMKAAGRYSFCKAHATAYAYIARACAYLKYHYPIEWWAAVLTNCKNSSNEKADLKNYWQYVSYITMPPDINTSEMEYSIKNINGKHKILTPLSVISGVGESVVSEILSKRPFNSLEDFVTRINRRTVNKRSVFKLIFSGAMDSLFIEGMNEFDKMQEYLKIKAVIEGKSTPEIAPEEFRNLTPLKRVLLKKSIFKAYSEDLRDAAIPKLLNTKIEFKGRVLNRVEKVFGDTYIVNHPEDSWKPKKILINLLRLEDIIESRNKEQFAMIGYIIDTKEKKFDNDKKTMLNLEVEIEDKLFNLVKFPPWEKTHHGIKENLEESICILLMRTQKDTGKVSIDDIIVIEKLNIGD